MNVYLCLYCNSFYSYENSENYFNKNCKSLRLVMRAAHMYIVNILKFKFKVHASLYYCLHIHMYMYIVTP